VPVPGAHATGLDERTGDNALLEELQKVNWPRSLVRAAGLRPLAETLITLRRIRFGDAQEILARQVEL